MKADFSTFNWSSSPGEGQINFANDLLIRDTMEFIFKAEDDVMLYSRNFLTHHKSNLNCFRQGHLAV